MVTSPLRRLDPRGWSRVSRVLVFTGLCLVGGALANVPRLASALGARAADGRFASTAVPSARWMLGPLRPALRLRVTRDVIDLDARQVTARYAGYERDVLRSSVEPAWRDAVTVESRGVVALRDGRVADRAWHRHATLNLQDRFERITRAFRSWDTDIGTSRALVPLFFIDASVPMETVALVGVAMVGGASFVLRGPRGLTTLDLSPPAMCGRPPSVEVYADARRLVVRWTPEASGCAHAASASSLQRRVVAREGSDRGTAELQRVLAEIPWAEGAWARRSRATDRRDVSARAVSAELLSIGPVGGVFVQFAPELPFGDAMHVVLALRERSPGACGVAVRDDCLFPWWSFGVGPEPRAL